MKQEVPQQRRSRTGNPRHSWRGARQDSHLNDSACGVALLERSRRVLSAAGEDHRELISAEHKVRKVRVAADSTR
jgi:hypothetical protein